MSGDGRDVAFRSLINFRDLGGLALGDGETVRRGRWFRGASLHLVDGEDVATLRSLGIRTALDLRTEAEIAEHGGFPARATGIEVRHLPLIPRTWDRRDDLDDPEVAVAYLVERFADMLDTGGAAIAAAVETLADPTAGPVVAYCMAGKDRTGVLTATVLALLGADDATIAADFNRSSAAGRRLFHWAGDAPGSTMVDQAPPIAEAPPAAILGFLDALRARFGSPEAFLAAQGVGAETVSALREQLVDRGVRRAA